MANGVLRLGVVQGAIAAHRHGRDRLCALCRQRTEANPMKDGMPMYGATVFVLEAARYQRI